MPIDFSKVASEYAAYRPAFPARLFERLAEFGIGLERQRVLDLGSGTGLFGAALTARGCRVVHVDPGRGMLQHPNSIVALAEAIPFQDACFDVVAAAQCWHWFDRNRAPREILRVLKPGAGLAAVYQMYIPLPGSVAEATERLILQHQPRWRHANSAGINGQVLRDMQASGFVRIESFTFDVHIRFTREAWRGFIRTTSPIGASMSQDQLEQFDRDHDVLLNDWPRELDIPHRVFAAVARKPIIGPERPGAQHERT